MFSESQWQALKTWLLANAAGLEFDVAAVLINSVSTPDYFVWKRSLDLHALTDETFFTDDGVTPTNFVWGGTQGGYINRSQGERDAFGQLFNTTLSCKPYLGNVRTAMQDIFSGSGQGAVANRNHFRAAARRPATNLEKIFAVATVDGPPQSGARGSRTNPDTLVVTEYVVTPSDVRYALQLP